MTKMITEQYIEHEVQLRIMDERHKLHELEFADLRNDIGDVRKELKESFTHLDNKMDSHFKWILATIIGLFVGGFGVMFPLLGAVIFHGIKLI